MLGRFQHRPTRQAGRDQRPFPRLRGAEPTAANRVRPCPHHPLSGVRCSPSVDDMGVSSRRMGLSPVGGCGGCPVAVASRPGRSGPVGTAAACQLVGVRQRAGAGGRWLGYGLLASMPVGSGPPRGRFALGYGLVLPHTLPLPGRRGSSGPCWPSSWPAVGGCRPFPAAVLPGPGHPGGGLFGGHLRQPVALSGRRGGRRPLRATRAGSLYRLGGVLAGGRAKLCRSRGPAW